MAATSFFVPKTADGIGTDVSGVHLSLVSEKTGIYLVFPYSTLQPLPSPITGQIWPRGQGD